MISTIMTSEQQCEPYPSPSPSDSNRLLIPSLKSSACVCKILTTQKAMLLVLMLDIFLGLWYIAETLVLLAMLQLVPTHFTELVISVVNNSVSVSVGVIAVLGLWGILKRNRALFGFYYKAKTVELVFTFLYCPVTSHVYCSPKDLMCLTVTLSVVCVTKIGFNSLSTYLSKYVYEDWQVSPLPRLASLSMKQIKDMLPHTNLP